MVNLSYICHCVFRQYEKRSFSPPVKVFSILCFRKNLCRLNMAGSKKCIALLAEGSEELELVASVDVLRRAGVNKIC